MFHSIGDSRHDFNISVDSFSRFVEAIKRANVIRLEEWESQEGFVCLTFDDVADSFYYNAYPLLKKYSIPFTIFVSCSLLNKESYITTEMLKEIAECELCTIGSHGNKHLFFAGLSKEDAIEDLLTSKDTLEKLTRKSIQLYAFPYGSLYACGFKRKRLVGAFYKYGFGTVASPITRPSLLPFFFLPRINVENNNIDTIINAL